MLDDKKMSEEVLNGKRKGTKDPSATNGLNSYLLDYGVYIRYNDPEALK